MTIRHGILSLSDTVPVAMVVHDTDSVQYSSSMSIQNIDDTASVYLGDYSVTTESFGFVIGPGSAYSLEDMPRRSGLYAISDINGSEVAILRYSK